MIPKVTSHCQKEHAWNHCPEHGDFSRGSWTESVSVSKSTSCKEQMSLPYLNRWGKMTNVLIRLIGSVSCKSLTLAVFFFRYFKSNIWRMELHHCAVHWFYQLAGLGCPFNTRSMSQNLPFLPPQNCTLILSGAGIMLCILWQARNGLEKKNPEARCQRFVSSASSPNILESIGISSQHRYACSRELPRIHWYPRVPPEPPGPKQESGCRHPAKMSIQHVWTPNFRCKNIRRKKLIQMILGEGPWRNIEKIGNLIVTFFETT